LSRPTISALLNLLDNYNPFVLDAESFTAAQEAEIDAFLDAVFETDVFLVLTNFALSKGMTSNSIYAQWHVAMVR
jgi:hypothetical protein